MIKVTEHFTKNNGMGTCCSTEDNKGTSVVVKSDCVQNTALVGSEVVLKHHLT